MEKYLWIFFLLVACNHKATNTIPGALKTITINIDKKEEVQLSYFIDSIKYIKLETRADILIAKANKVGYFDRLYYILDRNSNVIYTFDELGNFNFKINRQGRAPEEYVEIDDFTINEKTKTIDVLDLQQRKLIQYDLKNGQFISAYPLRKFIYSILAMDNGQYLGYLPLASGTKEFGLTLLDSATNPQKELIKYEGLFPSFANNAGNLYRLDNSYGIYSQTENMVYHYKNNSLEKKYKFDYEGYMTEADFAGYKYNTLAQSRMDKMVTVTSFKENKDWIIQNLMKNKDNSPVFMIYSKKDDKAIVIGEIMNFDHPWIVDIYPEESENQIINAITTPWDDMKKVVANSKKVNVDFKKVVESAQSDDNPVLQILYLKHTDEK